MEGVQTPDTQVQRTDSEPTRRVLKVLEFAGRRQGASFTLHEAAAATTIPKATLLRVLRTLVQEGYLADLGQRYQSNLFFSPRLPVSADHMAILEQVLTDLVSEVGQAAEALTVTFPNLYWFDMRESPDLPVRVVARPGTTRSLYELDAPSRLYLRDLGLDAVREKLVPGVFHMGPHKAELPEEDALRFIDSVDRFGVEYDQQGNCNGIRRFVTIVRTSERTFRYLLSIAEPMIPQNDRPEHVRVVIGALERARDRLNAIP